MISGRIIKLPFGVMTLAKGDCCADFVLSSDELARYREFSSKTRGQDFLRGRCAAKVALEKFCVSQSIDFPDTTLVTIDTNKNGAPYARGFSAGISISHSRDIAVAIAFDPAYSCGIDVEFFREDRITTMRKVSPEEVVPQDLQSVTIAWSAKEALSKALGTGFAIPLDKLKIGKWLPNIEFVSFSHMQCIVIPDSAKTITIVCGKSCDIACLK